MKIRIFLLFALMLAEASAQKQQKNFTKLSFWGTDMNHRLGFKTRSNLVCPAIRSVTGAMDDYDPFTTCTLEVARCYHGTGRCNLLRLPIDTNLPELMSRVKRLFRGWDNPISFEFDYGGDAAYTTFLETVVGVFNKSGIQKTSMDDVRRAYGRIPTSSSRKAIAFLQLASWELDLHTELSGYRLYETQDYMALILGQNEDSALALNRISGGRELAPFYEYMGDFWSQYGHIGQANKWYYLSYSEASRIADEYSKNITLQRISEKMLNAFKVESSRDRTFASLGYSILDQMSANNHIEEFTLHNKILRSDFSELFGNTSGKMYLYDEFACILENPSKRVLKGDVASLLLYLGRDKRAVAEGISREALIILLNYIVQNPEVPKLRSLWAIDNLLRLSRNQLLFSENRMIIDSMQSLSTCRHDYWDGFCSGERALSYLSAGLTDSAQIFLLRTDTTAIPFSWYGAYVDLASIRFRIAKEIALSRNDAKSYNDLLENYRWPFSNRSWELGDLVSFLVNKNRDIYDTLMRNKSDSIITVTQFAKTKSDSIANMKTRELELNEKLRISDSIGYQNEQAATQASNSKRISVIFSMFLFVLILGFLIGIIALYKTLQASRVRQEKAEIELEGLKAGYMGHLIGNNFQSIVDNIDKAQEDPSALNIALELTQVLSRLFYGISTDYGKWRSLLEEIRSNEEYVTVTMKGEGRQVFCHSELDETLAASIKVPNYFLLDIYSNAVKHGLRTEGRLTTRLIAAESSSGVYHLVIEDSGVEMTEPKQVTNSVRKSTGLDRFKTSIRLFNREKSGVEIFFDPDIDMSYIFDERNGLIGGTSVSIKIVLNEKS